MGSCVTETHKAFLYVSGEKGKHCGRYQDSLPTRPHKNCPRLSYYRVVTPASWGFPTCICILLLILCNKPLHYYGLGVNSDSDRNEYQEYFLGSKSGRCLGMTALPPSCVECLEIRELELPGTLRACTGL